MDRRKPRAADAHSTIRRDGTRRAGGSDAERSRVSPASRCHIGSAVSCPRSRTVRKRSANGPSVPSTWRIQRSRRRPASGRRRNHPATAATEPNKKVRAATMLHGVKPNERARSTPATVRTRAAPTPMPRPRAVRPRLSRRLSCSR
jgi:hypothetical protein